MVTVRSSSISSMPLLPPELWNQILDDIEQSSQTVPEDDYLQRQPDLDTAGQSKSVSSDLKSFSLVSRALRRIVLARLFRRTRLTVSPQNAPLSPVSGSSNRVPSARDVMFHWTIRLSQLARFLRQSSLGESVRSLIIKVIDGQGYYYSDAYEESQRDDTEDLLIRKHWQNLILEACKIEKLTIIAPPFCLGVLISIKLNPFISEVLHMPYQILSVERDSSSVNTTNLANNPEKSLSILSALSWNGIHLNEGSFLRYHADRPGGWQEELLSSPQEGTPSVPKFPPNLCMSLLSFEYVAIFPAEATMSNLMSCLQQMPNLRTFTFQTQPKQDVMHDSVQRELAMFHTLQHARFDVYRVILENIIMASLLYQRRKREEPFRALRQVHCRDDDNNGESYQDWLTNIAQFPDSDWSLFRHINGEFGIDRAK